MKSPVLEVSELSVTLGGTRAVENVSFSLAANEIVAIIGPNGAGKTTLFNLISGSIPLRAGRIIIDGVEHCRLSPDRIGSLGMGRSFQITSLFPELTVTENLRLAAQQIETPALWFAPVGRSARCLARVDELLSQFELREIAETCVEELSHGAQRVLEIAVAIATRPKLLLLDEPTQGLGYNETADMTKLIRGLGEQAAILLIEHDLDVVDAVSDRIIVMHQGRKIADAAPHVVRSDPNVRRAYLNEAAA